jgi:hypothetical protein
MGRPHGVRSGVGGGFPGKAGRPMMLSGGVGRRGRPQRQLDPVDAGDRGRLGHPLPQPEHVVQMAQSLSRGEDHLGLLGRP